MKQIVLVGLLITTYCFAMSVEEKQKIKCTLKKLHDSSKDSDFFAFYDLFMCIKSPDQQTQIPQMHKTILQQAGLLNGDELKPEVKEVFLEFAQEDEFKNTLLVSLDLE